MSRKTPYRYKTNELPLPSGIKAKDLDWVGFAWTERQTRTAHTTLGNPVVRHRVETNLLGPSASIAQVSFEDSDRVFTYRNKGPGTGYKTRTARFSDGFLAIPDAEVLIHDPVLVDFTQNGVKDIILGLHPKWFLNRPVATLGDAIAYGDEDVEKIILDHMHATLAATPPGTGVNRPLEDYLTDLLTGFKPTSNSNPYGPIGGRTYRDVKAAAGALALSAPTPDGTFTATAWTNGTLVMYLLEGLMNNPDAEILGRVEMPTHNGGFFRAFRGGGTGGGERLLSVEDLQDAFCQMVWVEKE